MAKCVHGKTIYVEYGHNIAIMGLLNFLQFIREHAHVTCEFDLFAIIDVHHNLDRSLDIVATQDHET